MAARMIPIERPLCVELWHDDADRCGDPREDRLLAVSVAVARPRRTGLASPSPAGWPAPVLGPGRQGARLPHDGTE